MHSRYSQNTHLHKIMNCYPDRYRPSRFKAVGMESGFSGAVIVRVRTGYGDFCLRGWPPGGTPRRRLLGLHRLLAAIFAQGVSQVAVPVAAKDCCSLVSVGKRFWQLEPWMPGRADFRDRPSDVRLRAAMSCLSDWHQAAATFRPSPDECPWFRVESDAPSPAVSERLQILHGWNADRLEHLDHKIDHARPTAMYEIAKRVLHLFRLLSPRLDAELQAVSSLRYALQPCLRDIWHDHVLFIGDDVGGLIDPSACRSENVTTDLARLLGSLVGDDRRMWDIALDEYGQHRSLAPEELRLMRILDRSGVLLGAMHWLDRHYWQQVEFSESQFQRIVGRLQAMHSRLEYFVACT